MSKFILQTRIQDTLAVTMNTGAVTCTLTSGNFGSPTGQQIITIDYDNSKAADFLCTIAGTAVTSMTLLNGSDVPHASGAKVAMMFVDEHYAALTDGTGFATGAIPATALSTSAITLGYAEISVQFAAMGTTTPVQVTGLTKTVTIPAGGRNVKITVCAPLANNDSGLGYDITIWDGTVGSGTLLQKSTRAIGTAADIGIMTCVIVTPSAGSKTYNVGLNQTSSGGSAANIWGDRSKAFLLVEAI